jgi:small GTP-binding protein
MNEDQYDYIYKIVLIGDSGVGKSNILSRYLSDSFSFDSKATVGVEFGSKNIKIEEDIIKVQIWDTAGQERYKSITNAYYKGAKGALLVFDLTRKSSFDSIDKWVTDLKANGDEKISIILIGNKSDLEENRQVTQEEAASKAEQHRK